jgi:hypothetical protein
MSKTEEKSLDEEHRNAKILMMKHKKFIENYVDFKFCELFLTIKILWLKKQYLRFFLKLIQVQFQYPRLTIVRFYLATKNIKKNMLFSEFHSDF